VVFLLLAVMKPVALADSLLALWATCPQKVTAGAAASCPVIDPETYIVIQAKQHSFLRCQTLAFSCDGWVTGWIKLAAYVSFLGN
jgi:hypothetical protein